MLYKDHVSILLGMEYMVVNSLFETLSYHLLHSFMLLINLIFCQLVDRQVSNPCSIWENLYQQHLSYIG